MSNHKVSKEQILKARQADLGGYLMSIGEQLTSEGGKYLRGKNDDKLVITGNTFYSNAHAGAGKGIEHGNAIDYLVNHRGMTFLEAVTALTNSTIMSGHDGGNGTDGRGNQKSKAFSLGDIALCDNQEKARQYLEIERYIGIEVISYIVNNGLLLQEQKTNNAFFPIHDEFGECVGGERQGITKKRFKGVAGGSRYGYGFNMRFPGSNGGFKYMLFFESAIDLLSFVDIVKYREKKTLDGCILVSMAGLKKNIVKHMSKVFSDGRQPLKIVLCIDNDDKGQEFINDIKSQGIDYSLRLPDSRVKDWNEQLGRGKQECTPIGRLKSRAMDDSIINL